MVRRKAGHRVNQPPFAVALCGRGGGPATPRLEGTQQKEREMTDPNKSPPPHTPGPWREEKTGQSGNILITDEQGVTVATCWKQPLDPPEWLPANARLIASAPDLLVGLERAF